ncbi:MAG: hypothetical protein ABGX27_05195 [Desulfurobacteriaceae bacterium]
MKLENFLKSLSIKGRLFLLVVLTVASLFALTANTLIFELKEIGKINEEMESLKHSKVHVKLVFLLQKHRGLTYLYSYGKKI